MTPRVDDPDEQERVYNARSMLSSLRRWPSGSAASTAAARRCCFFSEGIDYDITDIIREPTSRPVPRRRFMNDIRTRSPRRRARTSASTRSIRAGSPRWATTRSASAASPTRTIRSPASASALAAATSCGCRRTASASSSDETGGFAAVNRNDFTNVFDRIVRDNSSYYVLAYYPPSDKRDGKFHRIEVKVNRPGLIVRSRRGYAPPEARQRRSNTKTGGMPPEMFEAINSPLQVSGLTMRVFAAPFKGAAAERVGAGRHRAARPRPEPRAPTPRSTVSFMAIDASPRSSGRATIRSR